MANPSSSQTWYDPCSSSTSCPTVSCQAPAAAGLKGQLSPACEAALLLPVPTQPADTSLLGGWPLSPRNFKLMAGGEGKTTRCSCSFGASWSSWPQASAWEGKGRGSLALLVAEKPEISKSFSGTSLLVCKGLASCWHLPRFYVFTYLCQAIICIAWKFPASHMASKWDLLFSKRCLRHNSQCL